MADIFNVALHPREPVFMGNMVAALQADRIACGPADLVLTETGWTLFSIDLAADEAVFLDVGAETDLAAAPFSYLRQYETARRLLRMKLADFLHLPVHRDTGVPTAHLFNTGHCGSTLVHHALNRSGQAWCLSEPLFTFDLAMNRAGLARDRLTALLRIGTRLLSRYPGAAGRRRVVKHFSQSSTIMTDYWAADPEAVSLFQYRDSEAWCNSLFGFHQRLGGGLELGPEERFFSWKMMSANTPVSELVGLVDLNARTLTFDRLAAIAWTLHRQNHAIALDAGVPLYAFRYEDLVADRAGTLGAIFAALGLSSDRLDAGMTAFGQDSHEGTPTNHSRGVQRFDQAATDRIRRLLSDPLLMVRWRHGPS